MEVSLDSNMKERSVGEQIKGEYVVCFNPGQLVCRLNSGVRILKGKLV